MAGFTFRQRVSRLGKMRLDRHVAAMARSHRALLNSGWHLLSCCLGAADLAAVRTGTDCLAKPHRSEFGLPRTRQISSER